MIYRRWLWAGEGLVSKQSVRNVISRRAARLGCRVVAVYWPKVLDKFGGTVFALFEWREAK